MSERKLSFGIHTPQQHVSWTDLLNVWVEAERLGFDLGLLWDHLIAVGTATEGPCMECLTALTALAMRTKRIRIGTLVLANSYRHPAVLANMAATLDIVSDGRLELGIGAGWRELEYTSYGLPFPKPSVRIRQLAEAIQVLKLLWTEKAASFDGKYFQLKEAFCEPKPLQKPRPPIWVGGDGEQLTLRVVAEHADGWNTSMSPVQEYRHKLDVLAGHCQPVGRDPSTVRRSMTIVVAIGDDKSKLEARAAELARGQGTPIEVLKRRLVTGSPEDCAEQLRPFVELGVELFVSHMRPPYDYNSLQAFAEKVIPLLRE